MIEGSRKPVDDLGGIIYGISPNYYYKGMHIRIEIFRANSINKV